MSSALVSPGLGMFMFRMCHFKSYLIVIHQFFQFVPPGINLIVNGMFVNLPEHFRVTGALSDLIIRMKPLQR